MKRYAFSVLMVGVAFVLVQAACASKSTAQQQTTPKATGDDGDQFGRLIRHKEDGPSRAETMAAVDVHSKVAVLSYLKRTFRKAGFKILQEDDDSILVEHDESYKIVVEYKPSSQRLVFSLLFSLKQPFTCHSADVLGRVVAFNSTYDIGIAACLEGRRMSFQINSLLPSRGYSPKELGGFVIWWSHSVHQAMDEVQLGQFIE